MFDSVAAADLETELSSRRARLRRVIADIRAVLRVDIEAFVVRETKNAFLRNFPRAQQMDTEDVARLKKRACDLGKAVAARVDRELQDFSVWENPAAEPPSLHDLSTITRVWDRFLPSEQS